MGFMKEHKYVFDIQSSNIIARPALGGMWLEVYLDGRATEYGNQAMPVMGEIQFNFHGDGLIWPIFELSSSHIPEKLRTDYNHKFQFSGYISYAQIEAFEKERNGKDFSVQIKGSLKVIGNQEEIEFWGINSSYSLHKPSQEWLRILQSGGYKKYLFQELEFPADASADKDSIFSFLYRAREHFDRGLYRESINELRRALERLGRERKDKSEITQATNKYCGTKEDREAMSLNQRMLALRNSALNALHTGPHIDESDDAFTRKTAKALLVIVSSIVELFPEPGSKVLGATPSAQEP